MATDTTTDSPVEIKRFWFVVRNEAPLFHAKQSCPNLNGISNDRNREDLPVAHIPVDANEVGDESELNFCTRCGVEDPFE